MPVVRPRMEHRGPARRPRRHPPVHVVRVGDAEPRVEAVPGRQVLGQVPQVPLTDDAGGVADVPQRLGQGDLLRRQPAARIGEEDALPPPEQAAPQVDASRQQGRPARRAHRRLAVEARPPLSLGRHAVEVGGADGRVPVRPQVAPAEVVGGDDDDVGRPVAVGLAGGRAGGGSGAAARRREQDEAADRGQRRSPAPRGGIPAFEHRRIIVRHPAGPMAGPAGPRRVAEQGAGRAPAVPRVRPSREAVSVTVRRLAATGLMAGGAWEDRARDGARGRGALGLARHGEGRVRGGSGARRRTGSRRRARQRAQPLARTHRGRSGARVPHWSMFTVCVCCETFTGGRTYEERDRETNGPSACRERSRVRWTVRAAPTMARHGVAGSGERPAGQRRPDGGLRGGPGGPGPVAGPPGVAPAGRRRAPGQAAPPRLRTAPVASVGERRGARGCGDSTRPGERRLRLRRPTNPAGSLHRSTAQTPGLRTPAQYSTTARGGVRRDPCRLPRSRRLRGRAPGAMRGSLT